jgi:hypothetical protein
METTWKTYEDVAAYLLEQNFRNLSYALLNR